MHCPGCGVDASDGQNFCRSCGFNLEKLSEFMMENSSVTKGDPPPDRQRLMERVAAVGGAAFLAGAGVLAAFVIYSIIARMIIEKGEVLFGTALLLFLAGAIMLLAYVIHAESQKEKRKKVSGMPTPDVKDSSTTARLEPESYSGLITSVTEGTTDQLESAPAPSVRAKRSDELRA